jgi:dipeptidyl aminopeptidase/acylaminoacyl peptidase
MPTALPRRRLVDPTSIWVESGDGVRCEGLLFVPPEATPGEARATLVYAHGGPTWQVERRWMPDVQHLVAEGYTVLAPNFRGSTGYGRGFDRANDGDWGGGDWRTASPPPTTCGGCRGSRPTGSGFGGRATAAT